ncbi:MAG: FAD-dependent tricarballylate dehydrogenase TcuA [Granulosicoccus sp.]|nr:FAD-dependent tricarballylate dehydrogenase TcuA [Granulosicoccus sp.]
MHSLIPDKSTWDVIVVGGGNAALCAALEACESGKSVLLLEGAPRPYRGGNSRHTRNFRCMHQGPAAELTDAYLEEEYFEDLIKVTAGNTDEHLARITINRSEECLEWMQQRGVIFQPSLSGTLSLSRTNAFFLGGGKALVNAYYNRLEELGATVLYEAQVQKIDITDNTFRQLHVSIAGVESSVKGHSVILASGGFQSDLDWLARAWGPAARNFLIRGTPYNKGVILKNMLEQGAATVGDPTQCHCVAIDGRAPLFDGGIATRLDCVPFSVVLNKNGERFYDEGEDVWPKRYAIWGRLVAAQPEQIAYSVIDANALNLFMPSVFPPVEAQSLTELAQLLGIPKEPMQATIDAYNQSCSDGDFIPTELDGLSTTDLEPPKSNWARPIQTPPYYGFALKPGVTFTYLGLKVDENAAVQGPNGSYHNIWAAGEIMAGNILGQGYLAGLGMTIGTVFGRIAGKAAADYVN